MKIEVLGTGCVRCETLGARAKAAAERLGIDYELVYVKEINELVKRGVIVTPALVIGGNVVVAGRLPGDAEIERWIASAV